MGAIFATLRSDFWPETISNKAYKSVYANTVIVANASNADILVKVVLERKPNSAHHFATVHAHSYLCFWPWTLASGSTEIRKTGASVYVSIRFPNSDKPPVDDYAIYSHHGIIVDKHGNVVHKKTAAKINCNVWVNEGPVWIDDEGVNHKTW